MKIFFWLDCRRFYAIFPAEDIIKYDEWLYNTDSDSKFLYPRLSSVVDFTGVVQNMLELSGLKDLIDNDIVENIELPPSVNRIIEGRTNEKFKRDYEEFGKTIVPYIEFDHSLGQGPFKRPSEKQEWETQTNLRREISPLNVGSMAKKSFNKGLYGSKTAIRIDYPSVANQQKWQKLETAWMTNVSNGYSIEQTTRLPNAIRCSFSEKPLPSVKAKTRAILKITGLQMELKVWNCSNKQEPYILTVPLSYLIDHRINNGADRIRFDLTEETAGTTPSIYYDLGEFFYGMYFNPQFDLNTGKQATATATVTEGKITSIQITDQGAGYDNTKPPNITISDDTGTGAILLLTISANGKFTSIVPAPNFDDNGQPIGPRGGGYSNNVSIIIGPPPELKSYLLYEVVPLAKEEDEEDEEETDRFIYRLSENNNSAVAQLFESGNIGNSFDWIPDTYPNTININNVKNDIKMHIGKIIEQYYSDRENLLYILTKNVVKIPELPGRRPQDLIDSGEDIHICLNKIGFFSGRFGDENHDEVIEKTDLLNEGIIEISNSLENTPGISLITINYIKDKNSPQKPAENNIDLNYDNLVRNKLVINRLLQIAYTGGKP